MKSILKVIALILVALIAILLGIIFYFEFRFYLRLPLIKVSDFLPFYEEFLLSALPAPFIAVLFLKAQSKIKESGSRSFLRLALGIMWILDAILQVQPEMNNLFAQYNLIPMLTMGFPVTQVIRLSISVWNRDPSLMDLFAAVVQLYIGVLYLAAKKGRIFYFIQAVAIAWCAVIWVFGEGFGGVFTAGSSFLTGLPGSVIFYLVGAIVLVLTVNEGNGIKAERTIRYATLAALLISLGFQVYPADGFWTSLPVNYFPSPFGFLGFAVSAQIRISALSSRLNVLFVIVLIVGIILWVFKSTYAPVVTFCFSIFAWIVYQGLGIVAQFSTDSNTGLVLAILMVAYMLNNNEIKASGKKTKSLGASAAGGM